MIFQYDTTFRPKSLRKFSQIFSDGALFSGEYLDLLSKALKKETGCRHVFLVTSGTAALHIALLAAGAPRTSVILPSYSCQDLLNAVKYAGAKPRLVDISSCNYSLDIDQVLKSISSQVGAMIVPYMYGDLFSIDRLVASGVPVIEDIAHCIGATIKRKKVGSIGTVGIMSFGDRKYLDGGFGGAVFTNRPNIAKKIKSFLSPCTTGAYRTNYYKYQMPNLTAAIIYEKLALLKEHTKRRKDIAKYYMKNFRVANVTMRYRNGNASHFFRFMIDVPGDKGRFIRAMKSRDVVCGVGVGYPLHKMLGKAGRNLPNTKFASQQSVALPTRPNLKKHEMDRVVEAVLACL